MTDQTTQATDKQANVTTETPEITIQKQAAQIEALNAQVQKLQQEAHEGNIHVAALTRRLNKAQSEAVNMEGQLFQFEQIMQQLQQRPQ